jgi:transcription antitermination factor NusG
VQQSNSNPQWFCIVVEVGGCHRQVQAILADKGYRCFVRMKMVWVSHARVKQAKEKPLLGRYVFVELDPESQSFMPVTTTPGVEAVISSAGVPWPVPRDEVNDLLDRYLAGEFNETRKGAPPIGARVAIIEGRFENWLATVTGLEKGGKQISVKLLGHKTTLNKLPRRALRPALGFDLGRSNHEEVPK